jgi:hypothetical protein
MRAGRTACAVDRPETLVTELSAYEFSTLQDGPFTLSRGVRHGLALVLPVAPSRDYPSRESRQVWPFAENTRSSRGA